MRQTYFFKALLWLRLIALVSANFNSCPYYKIDTEAGPFCVPTSFWKDGNGDSYVTDTGDMVIHVKYAGSSSVSTLVGKSATPGDGDVSNGDGGLAVSGLLNSPWSMVMDSHGNYYVADQKDNKIRFINSTTNIVSTVAGNGIYMHGGDGGLATTASLAHPVNLWLDSVSQLFIADSNNHRIRKVDTTTGIITTVAGKGLAPMRGSFSGDGGPATDANLNLPFGLWGDSTGDFYIADTFNHRIRKVRSSDSVIVTIAGTGKAGYSGDDGSALLAKINFPTGVWVDGSGNVLIADKDNHIIRIVDKVSGVINTIAGTPSVPGYAGDHSSALSARLKFPTSIIGFGDILYVSDTSNKVVRSLTLIPCQTNEPTATPSKAPSTWPTENPTVEPSVIPTSVPTVLPSAHPSAVSTSLPTTTPSHYPTISPTTSPSFAPTLEPSFFPTAAPTATPSSLPTSAPTGAPTVLPSAHPSAVSTAGPTATPSAAPTFSPTSVPTTFPSVHPTKDPTFTPSSTPSNLPTASPSFFPTAEPTSVPTASPSSQPTALATVNTACTQWILGFSTESCDETCTRRQSTCVENFINSVYSRSAFDAMVATTIRVDTGTLIGTSTQFCTQGIFANLNNIHGPRAVTFEVQTPSGRMVEASCFYVDDVSLATSTCAVKNALPPFQRFCPCSTSLTSTILCQNTGAPSTPTKIPTAIPSTLPTVALTAFPSTVPTSQPTTNPSFTPTSNPTFIPTVEPSFNPTASPTFLPTSLPSADPTFNPSNSPSAMPSATPSALSSYVPTSDPTDAPTIVPSAAMTLIPSLRPTTAPSVLPSTSPTSASSSSSGSSLIGIGNGQCVQWVLGFTTENCIATCNTWQSGSTCNLATLQSIVDAATFNDAVDRAVSISTGLDIGTAGSWCNAYDVTADPASYTYQTQNPTGPGEQRVCSYTEVVGSSTNTVASCNKAYTFNPALQQFVQRQRFCPCTTTCNRRLRH